MKSGIDSAAEITTVASEEAQSSSWVVVSGPRNQRRATAQKRVWIDIDNSPHVPLFLPIIEELRKQEIELVLTARNMYQVCELLDLFHLNCKVVGGHSGKNKFLKIATNCMRAAQLSPTALTRRPNLALSHGSRAQILICKLLGIPTLVMYDYEHTTMTGFIESDWILMPAVIPDVAMRNRSCRILKYPGLKEDVYVPRFRPNRAILNQLYLLATDLIVTLRPPATEAHYHNPESEVLFAETVRFLMEHPEVRAVVLPRNARQSRQIQQEYSDLISAGRLIVPGGPIDGLNLIWFSDLVISGGGTMNREAAALDVPVYSIFRGKIGAVDRYLAQQGRLMLLETTSDIRTKVRLVRRQRPQQPKNHGQAVLHSIVQSVLGILAQAQPAGVHP